MRIAIAGTRGIPACYGGFETFAEELALRLVECGHEVSVYGRRHCIAYTEPSYRGVQLKLLPAPRHKYLETPVHALLCFLHLLFRNRVDVVLVCNAANSPFVWLLRLAGMQVAVNVDGIERMRAKWNRAGKLWYALGERLAVLTASRVVADADVIADYYHTTYGVQVTTIAYGHLELHEHAVQAKIRGDYAAIGAPNVFSEFSLKPGQYLLYVSRLEPENNAHLVIAAYNQLPAHLKQKPLVIVGDAPYAQSYIESLHLAAGENVIFTGFRFGQDYHALQLGAYLYFQATEVGGTHPALVEAMGFGNCIVANDTPEHKEVLGTGGYYYKKNELASLRDLLERLLSEDESAILASRRRAHARAQERYRWSKITNDYIELFQEMLGLSLSEKPTEKSRQRAA